MSAISTYLQKILTERWARNVRQAIHDAISQCYNDVNRPALQTEAMEAAVQAKIDAGEMAALTIGDGTITGAKLVDGTIPTAKIADGAVTAGKIASGVIPAIDTATSEDEGKALKAKTVTNGKVTEWEFGEAGGDKITTKVSYDEDDVENYASVASVGTNYKSYVAVLAPNESSPYYLINAKVKAQAETEVKFSVFDVDYFYGPTDTLHRKKFVKAYDITTVKSSSDGEASIDFDVPLLLIPDKTVLVATTNSQSILTGTYRDSQYSINNQTVNWYNYEVGEFDPQPKTYASSGYIAGYAVDYVLATNAVEMQRKVADVVQVEKMVSPYDYEIDKDSKNAVRNSALYDYLIEETSYTVNDAETTYLSAGKHNVDGMNQYYCGSCDAPTYGEHSVSRIDLHVGTNGETIVFGLWQFRTIQTIENYVRGYWSLVRILGSVVSADYKAIFEPSEPVLVDGTNQRIIATCTNKVISYRRCNFTPNPYKKNRVTAALARYQNNDFSNIAVGEESTLLVSFYNYYGWLYNNTDLNVVAYEITYTPTVPENIIEQKTVLNRISEVSVAGALNGKVWYCAGDSVTDGDSFSYADVIASRNNMILWRDGIGGSTMTNGRDSKTVNAFCFERYLNIPEDVNYITLWFGINDGTMQYTLGDIDSTDDSTFYGAYNKVLTWIINNRPLARVGLVVTHKAGENIQTAIRNLAKKYGFLTFDLLNDSSIPFWHPIASYYANDVPSDIKTLRRTQWWNETTMENPTHPSANGHKVISYAFEKWMMGL